MYIYTAIAAYLAVHFSKPLRLQGDLLLMQ